MALQALPGGRRPLNHMHHAGMLSELGRAFEFWNRRVWQGKLSPAVFVLAKAPPRAWRLMAHAVEAPQPSGRGQARILVYRELCLQEGIEAMFLGLVREMVSHWQATNGDPAAAHDFVNAEWRQEAERAGLAVQDRSGRVKAKAEFNRALVEFSPLEVVPWHPARAKEKKSKSKMRKWICACETPFAIWVARAGFAARCSHCGKAFKEATP